MIREPRFQQARHDMHETGVATNEVVRLDRLAARLMAVQRHWNAPDRDRQLDAVLCDGREVWHDIQTALAHGALSLPVEVRENLLILSVYAHSKIEACAAKPDSQVLGSLLALTRTLAGSLKEWRAAA